jgi:hypothetical protein
MRIKYTKYNITSDAETNRLVSISTIRMIKYVVFDYRRLKVLVKRNVFKRFLKTDQMLSQFLTVTNIYDKNDYNTWS